MHLYLNVSFSVGFSMSVPVLSPSDGFIPFLTFFNLAEGIFKSLWTGSIGMESFPCPFLCYFCNCCVAVNATNFSQFLSGELKNAVNIEYDSKDWTNQWGMQVECPFPGIPLLINFKTASLEIWPYDFFIIPFTNVALFSLRTLTVTTFLLKNKRCAFCC